MSCESEISTALLDRGLRRTTQRARILATLRHASRELTAAEVYARLQGPGADAPSDEVPTPISLSTVYRTLEGLRDAGIVSAHEAVPGAATFEWAADVTTHHHLRCVQCGATSEVELPRLASLEAEIRERTGFEPSIRHLAISGLCRECAASGRGGSVR